MKSFSADSGRLDATVKASLSRLYSDSLPLMSSMGT